MVRGGRIRGRWEWAKNEGGRNTIRTEQQRRDCRSNDHLYKIQWRSWHKSRPVFFINLQLEIDQGITGAGNGGYTTQVYQNRQRIYQKIDINHSVQVCRRIQAARIIVGHKKWELTARESKWSHTKRNYGIQTADFCHQDLVLSLFTNYN